MREERLLEKIKSLPPERVAEVEEFVDSLAQRVNGNPAHDARHDLIAAYAAEHGGSEIDLDPELESASLEHLHAESGERL